MLVDILVYNYIFRDGISMIVNVNLLILMHSLQVSISEDFLEVLSSLSILFSVIPLMAPIDPTCSQAFRTHCSLSFFDYHQSLRLLALLLDVLPKSVLFHDNIGHKWEQVCAVDFSKEINLPDELKHLYEALISHAFSNYSHALLLVDIE